MITRSALDNLFLLLESPNTPMHVAALVPLARGAEPAHIRRLLMHRCARLPTLHLLPTANGWTEQVDLHPSRHIRISEVDNARALRRLASARMAEALPAQQPAWHIDVMHQTDEDRVSLFFRLHHALADGVAASLLLRALADQHATRTPPAPSQMEVTAPSRSPLQRGLGVLRASAGQLVSLPTWRAPPTPFNRRVGHARELAWTRLSRRSVYATARQLGATPNDVVVAACAGGLRAYLARRHALPAQSLVAALPISLWLHGQPAQGANRLSGMACALGTEIADPRLRLQHIRRQTWRARRRDFSAEPRALMDLAALLPPPLISAAAGALAVTPLAEHLRLVFNLIITHVPGTASRLTLGGAALQAVYPFTPLFHGIGLVIGVFGCGDSLDVGLTGTPDTTRQLQMLADAIRTAQRELAQSAAGDSAGESANRS